jgi:hypothetical protein
LDFRRDKRLQTINRQIPESSFGDVQKEALYDISEEDSGI